MKVANKVFAKLFEIVITLQIICSIVFLLREYNHLDTIHYHYENPTVDMTINFYAILALIAVIFVVVILASINVLGSGLGDVGGRSLLRFVSFIAIFIVLSIGTSYYLQALGGVFLGIWTVISALAYILYIANINTETPV